jgi:hypothetical protein
VRNYTNVDYESVQSVPHRLRMVGRKDATMAK